MSMKHSNGGKILYAEHEGVHILKFIGDVRLTLGPTISSFLEQLQGAEDFKFMMIDLSETRAIDSTALGLLVKVVICITETFGCVPSVISPNKDITRVLESMAIQDVCRILEDATALADGDDACTVLPEQAVSERVLRDQVLEAHKTLMSLNEQNHDKFRDLVIALEEEAEISRQVRRAL